MRVLVTGGSGFIGTNLIEHFLGRGLEVANFDIGKPRNAIHRSVWHSIDILDEQSLSSAIREFAPTHVIHMAGRTDLQGRTINDYSANTVGLVNIIKALRGCSTIQRAVFASSMLVCKTGYRPRDDQDYCPPNSYGESKAMGEKLVRAADLGNASWIVVRPTSIWGPWFGEPYRDFFESVVKKRFLTFDGIATRTFGYVRNTVLQIEALLRVAHEAIHRKTIYLGDDPPMRIEDWAALIAEVAGVRPPRRVPTSLIWFAAKAGDLAQVAGVRPPLTSFRFRNITTKNEVNLDPIHAIAGAPPYSVREGVEETLMWLGAIAKPPDGNQG